MLLLMSPIAARAEVAADSTPGATAESALNWLMEHVDDHHLFETPAGQGQGRQRSTATRARHRRGESTSLQATIGLTQAVSRLKSYVGDLLTGKGAGRDAQREGGSPRKWQRVLSSVGGSAATSPGGEASHPHPHGGPDAVSSMEEEDGEDEEGVNIEANRDSYRRRIARGEESSDELQQGEEEEEEEEEMEGAEAGLFPNWLLEHAVSSRSTCRSCKGKIQEGEVRVGLQGFNAWGYIVRWYHLAHVKFPRSVGAWLSER
jgi:hypothetical protein